MFGFGHLFTQARLLGQFVLDLADTQGIDIDLAGDLSDNLFGRLFIALPLRQPQNIGKNLFAFFGRARGESVRLALLQERGIGERFVIQPQQPVHPLLGGAHGGFADDIELAVLALHQQVQRAHAATFARAPPHHAVNHALLLEVQLDVHILLALVDEVFIVPGARLTPQRPGDGVQQRGFARAVWPGQAGQVYPLETQRVRRAVGEKIFQFETNRQHKDTRVIP